MARNLALAPFNDLPNTAEVLNEGWYVDKGIVVNTLAGSDKVTGKARYYYGITNQGTINTGQGDDVLVGTSYYMASNIPNVGISNDGTINTGDGNDTITGTGPSGIRNGFGNWSFFRGTGTILTGAGDDTITGTGWHGISNNNKIDTGTGNDKITGTGSSQGGISNDGTIDTGSGNDQITGTGIDIGISNSGDGKIITGNGNDQITGIISHGINACGILNNGTINTGNGADIVDALIGGFEGNGKTYLGANNDTLKGFGHGNFYGGAGIDKILLGQGAYAIYGSTIVSSDNGGGIAMYVNEFEQIGGANGGFFAFGNGTLTVNSLGIATSFV